MLHTSPGEDYDLLVEEDGALKRVSFCKEYPGRLIGIFPFGNSHKYIELSEQTDRLHSDADSEKLLSEEFCERMSRVRQTLNAHLRAIKAPVVEGDYLTDKAPFLPGCGFIVSFFERTITCEYYGCSTTAKLRYMGRFAGKNVA